MEGDVHMDIIWMVWDLGQGHRIEHLFPKTQVAYLRGRRCKSDATDKLQVAEVVVLYVLVQIADS